MNICIITSSCPSHPEDIVQAPFIVPFIEGLKKRGHQVFVFTQDRKGLKGEFSKEVQIKWFPWMGSSNPLVHLKPSHPMDCLRIASLWFNGRKALLPFVKENQIDVCLALWVLPSGYFANDVYRRTGTPYSVWALGSDIYQYGKNPFLYPMMKRIIREARGVFADGFDLSKKVAKRFGRKCSFLATTRRLMPVQTDRIEGSSHPYRFLFVGRLEKVKGIDLLLHSMVLLNEESVNLHLTIVGKGGMELWVKNFVSRNGLETKVIFLGNVDDQKLASLYASSDCVVIPSRSESIPLVFSEALRFNKALIVADVGDMGTLGRQYGVAWVIPPESAEALKEAMKKRVESKDKEQTGVDDGRRADLMRLFDVEMSVKRFLADYEEDHGGRRE